MTWSKNQLLIFWCLQKSLYVRCKADDTIYEKYKDGQTAVSCNGTGILFANSESIKGKLWDNQILTLQ